MRSSVLCLTLFAVFAASAHADTYDFLVNECELYCDFDHPANSVIGATLELQIPNTAKPDSYTADTFTFDNFTLVQAGTSFGDGPSIVFSKYGFTIFGIYSQYTFGVDDSFFVSEVNSDLPLFSGNTSDPVFQAGMSDIYLGHTYYEFSSSEFGAGFLTVTDLDAVPTPEPSSWVLLATGLCGLLGVVTRRMA